MKTAQSGPNNQCGNSIIRMSIVGAMMILATACASQSGDHPSLDYLQAQLVSAEQACPIETVRTCEVIGGNKFRKRYGRCICARRD